MKKGTKVLVMKALQEQINGFIRAIKYCKEDGKALTPQREQHILKMQAKVMRLEKALVEIEGL